MSLIGGASFLFPSPGRMRQEFQFAPYLIEFNVFGRFFCVLNVTMLSSFICWTSQTAATSFLPNQIQTWWGLPVPSPWVQELEKQYQADNFLRGLLSRALRPHDVGLGAGQGSRPSALAAPDICCPHWPLQDQDRHC